MIIFNQIDLSIEIGCGRQRTKEQSRLNRRQPKIVGGTDVYEGEFPWIVSIRRHGTHHVSDRLGYVPPFIRKYCFANNLI